MKLHNPPCVVRSYVHDGKEISVVDDGVLDYGTKQRAFEYIYSLSNAGVKKLYNAPFPYGYGMLAMSWMCVGVGISPVFVISKSLIEGMSKTSIPKSLTIGGRIILSSRLGKDILFSDEMSVINPHAPMRNRITFGYASQNPYTSITDNEAVCKYLTSKSAYNSFSRLGMASEEFIDELTSSLRFALDGIPEPPHLWIACGSGATVRAIARVWPNTVYHCVRVGKKLPKFDFKTGLAPDIGLSMRQDSDIIPPYDTTLHYDAKAWKSMVMYAAEHDVSGHMVWNVGKSI